MRSRGVVLVLAVALAAAATVAVYMYVDGVRDETSVSGESVAVVVAKEDIAPGTSLAEVVSDGGFTTVAVPESALVEGVVTDLSQLEGRRPNTAILAGEQIPITRLQGSSALPGGTLGIPEGYMAVTIPLQSHRVLGGALRGGDHVTVFGTFDGHGASEPVTVAMMPDLQILKVGTSSIGSSSGGDIQVTVAVRPRDAQRLVFAQEQGSVWLSLLPVGQKGSLLPPVTLNQGVR